MKTRKQQCNRGLLQNHVGRLVWSAMALSLVVLTMMAGCERDSSATSDKQAAEDAKRNEPPVVFTTFYPTTYMVKRIVGDKARVVCPLPPGEDPAFWKPDEETVRAYQSADLIVINGANFERWVPRRVLPESRIVDTTEVLKSSLITFKNAVTHSHGKAGMHSHTGIDGHTWTDPMNARAQAGAIRDALLRSRPQYSDTYQAGFAALSEDLDDLDKRLTKLSEKLKDTRLICSHPAYNYLARDYGWTIHNVAWHPEDMPSDKQWAALGTYLQENPAHILIWEEEPRADVAERAKRELGLTSVVFSPVENPGKEALDGKHDFLSLMRDNIKRLDAALSVDKP